MAVALSVEEKHNEDNDSVRESLLTRCKVRVAARKLYVFFGAIIVIGFLVLISIIGVRSQVVSGLIPAAPAAGLSQHPCSCPRLWIGIEKKCSYFDREKNQTWSRADCHARSAYRAVIRSKEEQVFVLCNNSSPYYWIALSHQNLSQRWESDEVTLFNSSLFLIRGDEDFAFLNNQTVTSVCSSSSKLRWICSGQP